MTLTPNFAPVSPIFLFSVSPIGLEVSWSGLDFLDMNTVPPASHLELSEGQGNASVIRLEVPVTKGKLEPPKLYIV